MTSKALGFSPAMQRGEAQRRLASALAAAGIDSAALDARLLICGALGIDHPALICAPEVPLGADAERVAALAWRRLQREPVSRILGRREFFGLDFSLSAEVLDPRPDTEILVETALAHCVAAAGTTPRILDLGVGSGAVLAAILSRLPQAIGIGVDISPAACAVARRNFSRLALTGRCLVVCGDWTAPLAGGFDLIVVNPPYVRSADILSLERDVRDYDPLLALDGGADGLCAYRALVPGLPALLAPSGIVALEIGLEQGKAVAALLEEVGLEIGRVARDLSGHDRVLVASRQASEKS